MMNSDGSSSSRSVDITCTLCRNELNIKFNVSDYIKHVRLFHAYKPDFKITCGINGCLRSYSNLGTFKNHVSAAHNIADHYTGCVVRNDDSLIQGVDNPDSNDDDSQSDNQDFNEESFSIANNVIDVVGINEESNSDSLTCSKEMLQKSSALFLLGLKEKYKLTQVAIQGIIEGVTSITQQRISILRSQVCMANW